MLVVALFLEGELRVAQGPGFPLDDAWIHAVFARNLVDGEGFCFNVGEPIGASTSPLWTLCVSGVYGLTQDMIWGPKVLGAVLYLGGILLAYVLTLALTGRKGTALLAGVLVALLRWNAWGALSGMEVPLSVLLALSGLHLYLLAERSPRSRWLELGSTCCLALGSLARPEGLTLVGVVLLAMISGHLRRRPRVMELPHLMGRLAPHLLILVLTLGPFALFNRSTAGTWVPSTFSAKADSTSPIMALEALDPAALLSSLLAGPVYHVLILLLRLLATNAVLLPFAVLGWARLWSGPPTAFHPRSRLVPAALLLYPLAMSLVEPWSRLAYRYATILFVLYCIVGAVGLVAASDLVTIRSQGARPRIASRLVLTATGVLVLASIAAALTPATWWPLVEGLLSRVSDSRRAAEVGRAVTPLLSMGLLGSAGLLALLAVLALARGPRALLGGIAVLCVVSQLALTLVAAQRYGLQVKNINDLHVACGRWIDQHVPRDATLALDDIGAITYVCKRKVFDMNGLITPEAISYRRAGRSRVEYLQDVRPNYVVTVRPGLIRGHPELFRPVHRIGIENNIASIGDTLVVYATPWAREGDSERR